MKKWSWIFGIIVAIGLAGIFIEDEQSADPIKNQENNSVDLQEKELHEKKLEEEPTLDEKNNEEQQNGPEQAGTQLEDQPSSGDDTNESEHEFKRVKVTLAAPVDGDTIKVNFEGKQEAVRFLLIDTPETSHPRLGKQPFGEEAKAFTTSLVQQAKTLELEFDIGPTRDKYQRLLAYIYVDGKSVQEELLKQGLARVAYVYPPSTRYVDTYQALQKKAQQQGVGIWSIENYVQQDGYHKEVAEKKPVQDVKPKEPSPSQTPTYTGPYDPFGPDKDCGDFKTFKEAQAFFEAAGGPEKDPHRLDREKDGLACESLP